MAHNLNQNKQSKNGPRKNDLPQVNLDDTRPRTTSEKENENIVITKPEKQPSNMAHKAKETSQGEHNDNEKEEGWDIVATDVPQEQHSTVITQPERQQINMAHKENESNQGNHNDDEKEEDFDLVDKGEIQGVIGNKYFILSTGKTMNADTTIIDRLKEQIPDLQKVSEVDESDFILVLCPVVSRAGTDIEAAVQKLRNISDTKPALLVVLHHTFDPECVVPDSSRAVNRENTFTVDCLFHEDHGLLKCPKNDKSFATVTKHIQSLVPRQTWYNLNIASMCPWSFPQLPSFPSISNLFIQGEEKTQERNIAHVFPGNKYFILSTGKTMNADTTIIERLKEQLPDLQKVSEVDESDFILVLCPVVSRAGTDIEAAVQKLHNISDTKPAFLVVLHHTFDPECVVPDSSRAVKRENTTTVDCLFHEDHGLLKCPKNDKSFATVTNHIQPPVPRQTLFFLKIGAGMEALQTIYYYIASVYQWSCSLLPSFPSGEEKTQEPELRLVLLGRTGSGKRAARNTILGREERNQAATSTDTPTSTQQSESTQGEVAGKKVTVVDTPDWFSPGLSLEKLRQDVGHCVHLPDPGTHAFLLVIPVKQPTGEERGILEKMEEIFGERCWRNTMIIFSVTDGLQKENIEEFIQSGNQEVQKLVEKCGKRFHCLNIKESGDGSQVSELLEKIEKMVEENVKKLKEKRERERREMEERHQH